MDTPKLTGFLQRTSVGGGLQTQNLVLHPNFTHRSASRCDFDPDWEKKENVNPLESFGRRHGQDGCLV